MQRIFITGANRGYGLALAKACLSRGDQVFAACRDPDRSTDLLRLSEHHPTHCLVVQMDVGDEIDLRAAGECVHANADGLDLLINNAGKMEAGNPLGSLSFYSLGDYFRINSTAPLLIAQEMLPLLERGNDPTVLNVSSRWGSIAYKGDPRNQRRGGVYGYCASKAALNMITRALAFDIQQKGIAVLAIHPGGKGDPDGGPSSADEAAAGMLDVVAAHGVADSGRFFDWRGNELPW